MAPDDYAHAHQNVHFFCDVHARGLVCSLMSNLGFFYLCLIVPLNFRHLLLFNQISHLKFFFLGHECELIDFRSDFLDGNDCN
jgi:hypothetical protein